MSTDPFVQADRLVDELAALYPVSATFWGVPGHDHRWGDTTPEGEEEALAQIARWQSEVAAIPAPADRWGRLATHVLADHLALEREHLESGEGRRDLRHLASSFQSFAMAFDAMDTSSPAGWEAVAARLHGLGEALEGYRRRLALGLERGEAVAARQVRSAVEQGRALAAEGGAFGGLARRFAASGQGDAALAARIDTGAAAARAAYGGLSDWLEREYLPRATPVDAVGPERYARALRRFLGSTPDLGEAVAWGWDEVRRLTARMEAAAARVSPGRPLREVVASLQTDPRFAAPSAEAFLADMERRQSEALAALAGAHFDVPEGIRRLDVKRAPPGAPPGAWYVPPSEDLRRAGAVWYSLSDGPQPTWDEVSTAYHEGFPGHHLQIGIQVTLKDQLCRLHRLAYGYSGYAEGWALYAEELMGELGYYERPEYELGMLANQTMRACRVVFDVGAHTGRPIPADAPFHPGEPWSFDLGVALMTEVGGMTPETARSEVARYYGWPGQAPSYKLGQRVVLGLRDEFRAGGGTLRDFHTRVLGCGMVGLDHLRALVLTDGRAETGAGG